MSELHVDMGYCSDLLFRLLKIPSPSGYTDQIVHFMGDQLNQLKVPFELTRRGAIRANLKGDLSRPARAIVAHLDTLGAMVKGFLPNGRMRVVPIGHWSSRFAEGARVTVFRERGPARGTILPLKASGHTFNTEVDSMPVSWDHLELRVDERCNTPADLEGCGFQIGDFIAVDSNPECVNGFVNARHLDDKAGVAALLTAVKAVLESGIALPVDCHPLFTIFEEVGAGASAVLHGDVSEMIAVDNATVAPGQNSSEYGVTIAVMDSTGPFDFHLTRKLVRICEARQISFKRDVFKFYRCDAASAVEAGNDIRTALVGFGVDASHGYERVHLDSLEAVAKLLANYMISPPIFMRDKKEMGPLKGFPTQPT